MSEKGASSRPIAYLRANAPGESALLAVVQPANGCGGEHAVASRSQLFDGVTDEHRAGIVGMARVREFTRGELIYLDGARVEEVSLLTFGFAKVTKLGSSGTVSILGLGAPGDVLGAGSLLSTGDHSTTAEPLRTCKAVVWRASVFQAIMDRHPILYRNVIRQHVEYLEELEVRFHEMATEMVGPRVARQLVRLHDRIINLTDESGEIRLSREDLAQMTGTTLFSVSRLLSEWEACGILRSRRESVTICDLKSLRDVSDKR